MTRRLLSAAAICLLCIGCTKAPEGTGTGGADPGTTPPSNDSAATTPPATPPTSGSSDSSAGATDPENTSPAPSAAATGNPVAIASGAAALTPENTKIEFVGTHAGDKPDPRKGGFRAFTGRVEIDEATKAIKAVTVDIDAESLFTDIPNLTNHLKSADFFEVAAHPTAKFVSTKIEPAGAEGPVKVTGDLTLHGVTKQITFPVTASVTDEGLLLTAAFTIDRTEFDMTFGPDKVEKSVAITVAVGERTQQR